MGNKGKNRATGLLLLIFVALVVFACATAGFLPVVVGYP